MIKVAAIGYKNFPCTSLRGDIIVNLIPRILLAPKDLILCHIDIVEDRNGKSMEELVDEMIKTGTDIVHYVNYRDPYNNVKNVDQEYIKEVGRRNPQLPVLLTSAHPDAEDLAKKLNIKYLHVPFRPKVYVNTLKELVKTK